MFRDSCEYIIFTVCGVFKHVLNDIRNVISIKDCIEKVKCFKRLFVAGGSVMRLTFVFFMEVFQFLLDLLELLLTLGGGPFPEAV